jgi:hypothetical protein
LRTGAALFGRQPDGANKGNHCNGEPGTGHVMLPVRIVVAMEAPQFGGDVVQRSQRTGNAPLSKKGAPRYIGLNGVRVVAT